MSPFPTDPEARKRLQEAQRAETDALKAVELATRARDRVQTKLDAAATEVDRAKAALVAVSGAWRAALLLNEDVRALRRLPGGRANSAGPLAPPHCAADQPRTLTVDLP